MEKRKLAPDRREYEKSLRVMLQSSNFVCLILAHWKEFEKRSLSEKSEPDISQSEKFEHKALEPRKEQSTNRHEQKLQYLMEERLKSHSVKVQSSYTSSSIVLPEKSSFRKFRFLRFFIYSRIM